MSPPVAVPETVVVSFAASSAFSTLSPAMASTVTVPASATVSTVAVVVVLAVFPAVSVTVTVSVFSPSGNSLVSTL